MEFVISTPRYNFSSSELKRNIRYPATKQTQYKWRKFVIKDQESKLYEYTHRAFLKCITVSVECGCYPGSLHIFFWSRCISAPVCPPCSFPPLLQRNLSFWRDSLLCPCVLVQFPVGVVSEGCSAALHVARWAWGAKVGCLLTETWALPWGNGFHHEKELNSHVNSSLVRRLCVATVFSLFLLTFTDELPFSCIF